MVMIPRSHGRIGSNPQLRQSPAFSGLSNLGQAIGGIADARKAEIEQKEQADFALQSSKIGADINVLDNDLLLKVQSGELSFDKAVKYRQDSLETIKKQYKTVIPKKFEHNFNNYFEQHSYGSAAKYLPIAKKSEQQQAIVHLKDMKENYLKNPNSSEKEVWDGLNMYAQSKGIPIAHVQDTFSEYKNNRAGNDVSSFFLGHKNNSEKLSELVSADSILSKFPNLTQEQAVYWSSRVSNQLDQNNRAQTLQQKQIENDAKDAVSELRSDISTGLIPSESVLKSRLQRVKGTQYEAEFIQHSNYLVEVQKLMRLGPSERDAYLTNLRFEAQNNPQDNVQDLNWRLNLLSKANENMLAYEKNNPSMAYSIKTGQDLKVVPTSAIINGDLEAISNISKNLKAIKLNNEISGTVGSLNPFSTQQKIELKQYWGKASPGDKLHLLTTLYKSSAGNPSANKELIQSIAGESGAYRLSASLNHRGHQDIAGQIITGQDLIEKNLVKVDDNALRLKTASYLEGITSPGKPDFQIYLESVKANYAYLVQKSEKVADSNGSILNKTIDEDLFNKAILNVTGGKFKTGGLFGAKSTVLRPHTVSEESFKQQLEQFNSRNYRVYGGSDRDYFMDLPLEQDPKNPYVYYFKNGSKYVMDVNDKTRKTRLSLILR